MRLVVCISGGGTTLQNLIDRIADGRLVAEIVGVIASNPGAFGIQRAQRAGIPVQIIERTGGGHSERLFAAIREYHPDVVCLAGWLNLIRIPADFAKPVLNVHPSLLPAFGGKGMYGHRVHEAVLAYGAKVSGCTVHFADDTYDTGPIVVNTGQNNPSIDAGLMLIVVDLSLVKKVSPAVYTTGVESNIR